MSEIKWIKLSVNMFDDEKIKLIRTLPDGDKIVMIWVQMMCLAGKINDGGSVYMGQNLAYSDEMLATIFNQPLNVVRAALNTLDKFEMINISTGGVIDILNWEKHQSTDKMAQIKQQNRERQQKYYYRNKLRELGFQENDMPNSVDGLIELYEKQPNVSTTLANGQEVRSKKLEVRSKKLEVNKTTEPAEADSGDKSPVDDLKNRFELLWSNYPKKTGKKDAFRHYKRAIKDGTNDDEIAQGIDNYLKRITIEKIKPQYIKGGSAWFNGEHWNDEVQTTLGTNITYQAPATPVIKEYVQTDAEREEAERLLAERQARKGDKR